MKANTFWFCFCFVFKKNNQNLLCGGSLVAKHSRGKQSHFTLGVRQPQNIVFGGIKKGINVRKERALKWLADMMTSLFRGSLPQQANGGGHKMGPLISTTSF